MNIDESPIEILSENPPLVGEYPLLVGAYSLLVGAYPSVESVDKQFATFVKFFLMTLSEFELAV